MSSSVTLQQAIELSQKILLAIDHEDWDNITVLDQQRSELIRLYFEQTLNPDKKLTQTLKQLNDDIVSRLISVQQNNRTRQITLTHAQKASKAYLDNS